MGIAKVDCYWINDFEVETNRPVEIYVDKYPLTPIPKGTIRFCLSHEPLPHDSVKAFNHPEFYTYLLTWKEEHLARIPHAVFFEAHDTRVIDYEIKPKEFGVSTVVGEKGQFAGHQMRHILWFRKDEIKIPKKFYLSGNKKWREIDYTTIPSSMLLSEHSKDLLWDTQFHICIENIPLMNFFTEKIIDCFISKTVPVYIGAPNIGKFFNTDGIVVCNSLDDIIAKCNSLTPGMYETMIDAIEDNYKLAHDWIPHLPRFKAKINELIKEYDKLHP